MSTQKQNIIDLYKHKTQHTNIQSKMNLKTDLNLLIKKQTIKPPNINPYVKKQIGILT
jgi:hypothetical protein